MKTRLRLANLALVCAVSLLAAASWQKDSAPFSFGGSINIKKIDLLKSKTALSFYQSAQRGIFTFSAVQAKSDPATTISIYTAGGALIQKLHREPGQNIVVWNLNKKVTTGIYLARIAHQNISREIKISVVR